MKYSYVKYYLMRWDMIQDGWIKVEVLSIVIEWSLVNNLVTSENKGNSAEISKKKKSHNLRHTVQYLTLVKKCLRFHDIIIWGCYRFFLVQGMESTPIYKGWNRDILSLSVPNLYLWFDLEGSQLLIQIWHHELSKWLKKGWSGWPLWGGIAAAIGQLVSKVYSRV